jgi:hypothetical protein
MKTTIETTYDDDSPRTLRDEHGFLWRFEIDGGDGTFAVAKINEGPHAPEESEAYGDTPCGVATWFEGGITIDCAASHGENHTDPTEYSDANGESYIATQYGWLLKD